MNKAQAETASTCCTNRGGGCNVGGFNLNNSWVWIIVVFVVFCCCNGNFAAAGGQCCGRSGRGPLGGFLGSYWVIILIVILCACSGTGFGGGFLGSQGNVNTNVINVQSDDGYEDDGGIF